ncbi:hypothetical protein M514_08070 [Trichuris suis]|uniref:Uncharacterized protein n=1 Tax=Trichuris suis TaxID=68888 RepID=A0A085NUU7_9BILA|nr:hypothetical protein M513_08070 [Trichuris suis]KFD73243.1 hypothetical protein M514_08070 [Trichuris suis]
MSSTDDSMQPQDDGNDGNGDDRKRGTDDPDESRQKQEILQSAFSRIQRVMDFLTVSEKITNQYIEEAADELERIQRSVATALAMGYTVPPFFLGNVRERFLNMFSYRSRLEMKRKRKRKQSEHDKKRCKHEDDLNEDEPASGPSGTSAQA